MTSVFPITFNPPSEPWYASAMMLEMEEKPQNEQPV